MVDPVDAYTVVWHIIFAADESKLKKRRTHIAVQSFGLSIKDLVVYLAYQVMPRISRPFLIILHGKATL